MTSCVTSPHATFKNLVDQIHKAHTIQGTESFTFTIENPE